MAWFGHGHPPAPRRRASRPPRTRRWAGLLAAALFVVVFPANIKMAVDWSGGSTLMRIVGYGRLPLQIPLVLWALHVRRMAAHPR